MKTLHLLFLLSSLTAAGCSEAPAAESDATRSDTTEEGDGTTLPDISEDDVEFDTPPDAEPDAAEPDAIADAEPDIINDVLPDVDPSPDSDPDVIPDTTPDTTPDVEEDTPISPAECTSNAECEFDSYCNKEGCAGIGICRPRPEFCPRIFAPVCGCDGETYSNACEAASAGTNVKSEGECG